MTKWDGNDPKPKRTDFDDLIVVELAATENSILFGGSPDDYRPDALRMVNAWRKRRGVAPLTLNEAGKVDLSGAPASDDAQSSA